MRLRTGETYSTEGPQCPYCERQFTADDPGYFDENNYNQERCDQCNKLFTVSVETTTSWTCEPTEQP